MDQDWGLPGLPTENPPADVDSAPGDFNFGLMEPGRLFTIAGQQFRYLENQGGGNHLIIRNEILNNVSFGGVSTRVDSWYNEEISEELRGFVQPVANSFTTGEVGNSGANLDESGWQVNLSGVVATDESRVDLNGTPRAFSLSLADISRLSAPGLGFSNFAQRIAPGDASWWLRTPVSSLRAWSITTNPPPFGRLIGEARTVSQGVRPALIIHQPGT